MEWAIPLLTVAAAMSLAMLATWWWQWRGGKAGFVDVVWTFGMGASNVVLVLLIADGLAVRRIMLAVLIGMWSLRLGSHLLVRVLRQPEDERYVRFKKEWGPWAQVRLFAYFQAQAWAAPLFAAPLLVGGRSEAPIGWRDGLVVAIWLIAMIGEWQADRQLAAFRQDPENRRRVCQQGWWRYTRHPNYFFEWLHWCSYVPLAISANAGWLSLLAPAAMYYFLNYVTGIPPAETQAIASRGEAYREYQRRTSPFFPWPRKTG